MSYHFTLTRMATIKQKPKITNVVQKKRERKQITNVGEDVDKLNTGALNIKYAATVENCLGILKKLNSE